MWDDELSKARIGRWSAVSAAGLQGEGTRKRGVFLAERHLDVLSDLRGIIKDANMYPWCIQSLGSFLGILLSKLLTSLVQCIIKCSESPSSQNLWVHVSKGTCSHDQYQEAASAA